MHAKTIDITGQRFGRLTVLSFDKVHVSPCGSKNTKWNCFCDCGSHVSILAASLKSGVTKSCGCHKKDLHTKHGKVNTGAYSSWAQMKSRCNNPNMPLYNNYGGRGIKVCDRWDNFSNFYEDMGDRPKGMSIERIDVNGDYEPSNCKWATVYEQANNTTRNNRITFNGETKNIGQWAALLGLSVASLKKRISKWTLEMALSTPKGERN